MLLPELYELPFCPAYLPLKNGKPNSRAKGWCGLKGFYKKIGVYIIKEDGIIVYIGMSCYDVQDVLYRHFQEWSEPKWSRKRNEEYHYPRVTYVNSLAHRKYEVYIIECKEKSEVEFLEAELVLKYNPRDNKDKFRYYTEFKNSNASLQSIEQKLDEAEIPPTLTINEELDELPF